MSLPFRLISPATSLHTKLMLTLAILVSLVVIGVTYVLLGHERETQVMELEGRAARITDLASRSLAYPVWNVDLEAIDEILDSIGSDPEVEQFSITAVGYGELRQHTKSSEPLADPIVRTQAIYFATTETGLQKIGEVRVVMTRALVEQAITEAHRAAWMLVIVIIIILYLATFVLLRRMVSLPIKRLENIVDRIALGDLDTRCAVESGDELGRLALQVNTMTDRLQESDASLRNSERRLQLVLDGSQLGYWDWDIQSGEVSRDTRSAEMLGYTLEEVNNTVKQWTDLHHPDDKSLVWKSINDHLDGRTPAHEIEYRMRTKEGSYKWILDQAQVVSWDPQGQPLRMCGTHKDITERKLAEQERDKLQSQLTQAQKMESVGLLAGGVAHDYNNMLSVIIGYTEIALDQVDQESSLHEDLLEIHEAGKRSADITRQLLAFARQQTIAPKILDLNETVESMIKMLRRLIGEDISLAWLPGLNLEKVNIDPSQLNQLLANLCVNARDAIKGVGKVTVETSRIDFDKKYCKDHPGFMPGDYILLAVSDDGCGIDKEILLKIFEPFFTTKKVGHGTGLGLATVYGIVKQNEGFVNVYSEPGHGTTFKIFLPVQIEDAFITQQESVPEIDIGGSETILMVEDDAMVLKMGKKMLQKLGYTVLAANAPADAIELAEKNVDKIHLVMTDVVMPDMNGRDLAAKLRTRNQSSKILFMSGYTADVIANHGILDEGVCFIHKPFSSRDLAIKVREALKQ